MFVHVFYEPKYHVDFVIFLIIFIGIMATSTKKLSQQELRQLMREKVQNKTDIRRIDSPLARYDDRGQLWCRICNQIINNEFLWSTHLIGKLHKKV